VSDVTLHFDLHPAQSQVFNCQARFIVAVAGRRFGKSWLAAVRALTSALDARNVQKMPVGLIAPTYPTARTIYWKRLLDMAGPLVVNSNVNLGIVELVGGVEIHIKGADRPDSLRGVGWWDVVIDEFADQKPEIWELIIRPALSDAARFGGGRALFIGTPKGRNHFYGIAQKAIENTDGDWAFFTFTTAENPFIDEKEIRSAVQSLSSAAFRQEYMASFESAGGTTFKKEWFKQAAAPKGWRVYIAVDLAGFELEEKARMVSSLRRDETAIVVVLVDGVKWHVLRVEHGRWTVRETALRIARAVHKHKPVAFGLEQGILRQAVEPFLREEMQRLNCMVPIGELRHGNQKKTDRIVWALQGRFEHGNVTFEEGAEWVPWLEDQLLQFPSESVHDDGPDGLAYIDQLVQEAVWAGFEEDQEERLVLDADTGY
jgi:phage terminase large subunit-like protein